MAKSLGRRKMREAMEATFKEMGINVEGHGGNYLYATRGRYAPMINTMITLDEDGGGATVMAALEKIIAPEKRAAVCELLNLVHGQSLWNVRFHLDDEGRIFSIGKMLLWGKPFNSLQFGDVFFSLLVTTDRLFPCLNAILEEDSTAVESFEAFFMAKEADEGLKLVEGLSP
jgi:hypothetical protein